jgi:rhodanese-related sulfurtransferase
MNDVLQKLPQFLGNHLALAALFLVLVLALVALEVMKLLRKYQELTPAALTQLINRENALVIDLSAYADFEKAHIPGSRHIAPSQFDPEHKDLAKARELPIVCVSKAGAEADKAAQRLVKAGFTRVYTLGGGVFAWQQAQLPVAKGKN